MCHQISRTEHCAPTCKQYQTVCLEVFLYSLELPYLYVNYDIYNDLIYSIYCLSLVYMYVCSSAQQPTLHNARRIYIYALFEQLRTYWHGNMQIWWNGPYICALIRNSEYY